MRTNLAALRQLQLRAVLVLLLQPFFRGSSATGKNEDTVREYVDYLKGEDITTVQDLREIDEADAWKHVTLPLRAKMQIRNALRKKPKHDEVGGKFLMLVLTTITLTSNDTDENVAGSSGRSNSNSNTSSCRC